MFWGNVYIVFFGMLIIEFWLYIYVYVEEKVLVLCNFFFFGKEKEKKWLGSFLWFCLLKNLNILSFVYI